jgi:hypothetical protein
MKLTIGSALTVLFTVIICGLVLWIGWMLWQISGY